MKDTIDGLRQLANFLEDKLMNASCNFPEPYPVLVSIYVNNVNRNEETNQWEEDSILNKEMMREAAKLLGSASKNYGSYDFSLHKKFGPSVSLRLTTSRESVCRKIDTGKTRVQTKYIPSGTEEVPVIEWECDPSILKYTE